MLVQVQINLGACVFHETVFVSERPTDCNIAYCLKLLKGKVIAFLHAETVKSAGANSLIAKGIGY